MKIEQISENQIKCTLNRSDLASRQIKISELAYGSEKTKGLFQDMMDQAFVQFGFETSDLPLMIEAIPVSMDCIILMITRVDEPDEVDENFSSFSNTNSGNVFRFSDEGKAVSAYHEKKQPEKRIRPTALPDLVERIFSFDSLSSVVDLARCAGKGFKGNSSLYKSPENGKYYLLFDNSSCSINYFGTLCSAALEYAHKEPVSYARGAFISEHFDVIIEKDALPVLSEL